MARKVVKYLDHQVELGESLLEILFIGLVLLQIRIQCLDDVSIQAAHEGWV